MYIKKERKNYYLILRGNPLCLTFLRRGDGYQSSSCLYREVRLSVYPSSSITNRLQIQSERLSL